MFLSFTTQRGEAVTVNVAALSYVGKSKGGTVIVLTDGSLFTARESYEELLSAMESCERKNCVENVENV